MPVNERGAVTYGARIRKSMLQVQNHSQAREHLLNVIRFGGTFVRLLVVLHSGKFSNTRRRSVRSLDIL